MTMNSYELHKSFIARPVQVLHPKTGEVLDKDAVLDLLKNDVKNVTCLAEWILEDDKNLLNDLDTEISLNGNKSSNYLGRRLNIVVPKEFSEKDPDNKNKKSGTSRFVELVRDRVITEAKSWLERKKAVNGTSTKYINAGWKRTMDATRPSDLKPTMNLAAVDRQYARIVNNPFETGKLELELVIAGQWHLLVFEFDTKRFKDAKRVTLPVVRINANNNIVFDFSATYDYNFSEFSSRYIVGVDVGRTNPATVAVMDVHTREIVESSFLSQRVRSLKNSIDATSTQIVFLHKKLDKKFSLKVHHEIVLQRASNSRKKKELAILVGQEVSALSVKYNNAIVVVEDLSHIKNTMMFGRWNRGAVNHWIKHYVELNGGRVFEVNAAYTSQKCYVCGEKLDLVSYHVAHCVKCDTFLDRDINAAANIALRFFKSLTKCVETRKKAKRCIKHIVRRSPVARKTLKQPIRKTNPTPKQTKKKSIDFNTKQHVKEGRDFVKNTGSVADNSVTVATDDGTFGSVRTLEKQPGYDSIERVKRLYRLERLWL